MYVDVYGEEPLRDDEMVGLLPEEIVRKCRETPGWLAADELREPTSRKNSAILREGVDLSHPKPVYWRIERVGPRLKPVYRFVSTEEGLRMYREIYGEEPPIQW
jgi:hypothetical protein